MQLIAFSDECTFDLTFWSVARKAVSTVQSYLIFWQAEDTNEQKCILGVPEIRNDKPHTINLK